jgi:pilus assembly protein CpaF
MSLARRLAARHWVEEPRGSETEDRLKVVATKTPPTNGHNGHSDGNGDSAERRVTLNAELAARRSEIHDRLVERHADELDITDREQIRNVIEQEINAYVRETGLIVTRADRHALVTELLDIILGLGPLQPLLEDPDVIEVMINRADQIYVERAGRTELTDVRFESEAQLKHVIDRVASSIGRHVDESMPMCDARLKDGSRVHMIIPPLVPNGACMTIRKFGKEKLRSDDLIRVRAATPQLMRYLEAAVRSRLSIIISGGTSSGKTTLLNILSGYIPREERVITIEDSCELQLQQPHVITMETRPPNVEGEGAVVIRDLVKQSLRMRPDRVIVGETRGPEALDMLQAMNTGHEGSMSTVHANSPIDAISRLETMVLMGSAELPSRAILKQITSAVHVIVQVSRLRGGVRRIVSVSEVMGLVDGEAQLQEIFRFRQLRISRDGRSLGYHTATGIRSQYLAHFEANGEELPLDIFEPTPEPRPEELY